VEDDRLRFIQENQNVSTCETRPNEPDPPVFSDAISYDGSGEGMHEVCPSLSHFLTTFCLQELVFGAKHLSYVDTEIKDPCELVEWVLQPIWLDGMYVYRGATSSFFLCGPDLILMHTKKLPPVSCWLASNERAAASLFKAGQKIERIR
jgi:hypothetical protein